MIIKVENTKITVSLDETLVARSVNTYCVSLKFDDSWIGYTRKAVFCKDGIVVEKTLDSNDKCTVPWEVLRTPGFIKVGVYGLKDDIVRPTLWSKTILVHDGVRTGEESGSYKPETNVGGNNFVRLIDASTGKAYDLSVVNGKLTMSEVD